MKLHSITFAHDTLNMYLHFNTFAHRIAKHGMAIRANNFAHCIFEWSYLSLSIPPRKWIWRSNTFAHRTAKWICVASFWCIAALTEYSLLHITSHNKHMFNHSCESHITMKILSITFAHSLTMCIYLVSLWCFAFRIRIHSMTSWNRIAKWM